jgi:hypothetical protein
MGRRKEELGRRTISGRQDLMVEMTVGKKSRVGTYEIKLTTP